MKEKEVMSISICYPTAACTIWDRKLFFCDTHIIHLFFFVGRFAAHNIKFEE
jgi:hypothetical protein